MIVIPLHKQKEIRVSKDASGRLKKYPYKEAIKLLAALPNLPPAEKAQRLLRVSQAVIEAVQQYWQFRAPNTDVASMLYAHYSFCF